MAAKKIYWIRFKKMQISGIYDHQHWLGIVTVHFKLYLAFCQFNKFKRGVFLFWIPLLFLRGALHQTQECLFLLSFCNFLRNHLTFCKIILTFILLQCATFHTFFKAFRWGNTNMFRVRGYLPFNFISKNGLARARERRWGLTRSLCHSSSFLINSPWPWIL